MEGSVHRWILAEGGYDGYVNSRVGRPIAFGETAIFSSLPCQADTLDACYTGVKRKQKIGWLACLTRASVVKNERMSLCL